MVDTKSNPEMFKGMLSEGLNKNVVTNLQSKTKDWDTLQVPKEI